MKRQTIFLFLPIFLVFFVWGLQVGNNLEDKLPTGSAGLLKLEKNIGELPNGQKSIMIFVLSHFDTKKPELFGVWMMSYLSGEPYVTVLSIYPNTLHSENAIDILMENAFQLTKVNGIPQLDEAFINALSKTDIWFSGYLLLDQEGLAEMINLSGELTNQTYESINEIEVEQLMRNNDSSVSPLMNQTYLLQQLCNKFTLVDSLSDLASIRNLFPQHISGNLDPDVMMRDWEQFIESRHGSFCVFPQEDQLTQINK